MKLLSKIIAAALFLAGLHEGVAQSFINLNFESANTAGFSSPDFIPTNNAVPGWIVYAEGAQSATVPYNTIALDGAAVDLQGLGSEFSLPPIQGNFSVFVQGGSSFDSNTNGAFIEQTARIPFSTKSITYWGGALQVTFNGQPLAFNAIGSGTGYTIWQANISAFAGQVGTLAFDAPWQTSGLLDNIQFSPVPAPEPTPLALIALGAVFLGFRRWKNAVG